MKNMEYKQFADYLMLNKQGKSQYQIASIYNVTRSTIQQILEGKTYHWVI